MTNSIGSSVNNIGAGVSHFEAENSMKHQKTIEIQANDLLVREISSLANNEGHTFEEMIQILLEDAIALRRTIKAQSGNHNHSKRRN